MENDELLWQERENMSEEEIRRVIEEEEKELQNMMMGFSKENLLSTGPVAVEEEDEEEEEIVKILPDGTIVSEAKEKEEKEEESGLNVDPLLLIFGARLKTECLKEVRDELYDTMHKMEIAMDDVGNEWARKSREATFRDLDGKLKTVKEELRLSTGFSDDATDIVERANRIIEDKELELVVLRKMDGKIKALLSLTD